MNNISNGKLEYHNFKHQFYTEWDKARGSQAAQNEIMAKYKDLAKGCDTASLIYIVAFERDFGPLGRIACEEINCRIPARI